MSEARALRALVKATRASLKHAAARGAAAELAKLFPGTGMSVWIAHSNLRDLWDALERAENAIKRPGSGGADAG